VQQLFSALRSASKQALSLLQVSEDHYRNVTIQESSKNATLEYAGDDFAVAAASVTHNEGVPVNDSLGAICMTAAAVSLLLGFFVRRIIAARMSEKRRELLLQCTDCGS